MRALGHRTHTHTHTRTRTRTRTLQHEPGGAGPLATGLTTGAAATPAFADPTGRTLAGPAAAPVMAAPTTGVATTGGGLTTGTAACGAGKPPAWEHRLRKDEEDGMEWACTHGLVNHLPCNEG